MPINLANCEDFQLPVTSFNDCAPQWNLSEIEKLYIAAPKAANFTDITSPTEWATRISQTTLGDDAIRVLSVAGDKPAPAGVVLEGTLGRTITVSKDHTVNYSIDDISDENYKLMQFLEAHPYIKLYAYETQAGKMYYYGNNGIVVTNTLNHELPRGRNEKEVLNGVITWRKAISPDRMDSPLFEGEISGGGAAPTTFENTVSFAASATPAAVNNVGFTALVTDPEQKIEFDSIPIEDQTGLPNTMSITVGGVEELTVDFNSVFAGEWFRYTAKNGTVYTGKFVDGTRAF
ncbi:MAG TPA: hypothetical protein VD794_05405 [Flavisolibacter sp.]|nr:hypothetical protein [Flavisolibacter sp.]